MTDLEATLKKIVELRQQYDIASTVASNIMSQIRDLETQLYDGIEPPTDTGYAISEMAKMAAVDAHDVAEEVQVFGHLDNKSLVFSIVKAAAKKMPNTLVPRGLIFETAALMGLQSEMVVEALEILRRNGDVMELRSGLYRII